MFSLIFLGWLDPLLIKQVLEMSFLYGQKLFDVMSNETSRKSVDVFSILMIILNPNFDISLIMIFLIFSSVLPEDCLIISSPSSRYRPILDGPTIGYILIRKIIQPGYTHLRAMEGTHSYIEIILVILFGPYPTIVANNCLTCMH